tara:strand:- start:93 stop:212 length:120 start_codon:yes stop_codon:yes gene_type:complete
MKTLKEIEKEMIEVVKYSISIVVGIWVSIFLFIWVGNLW